MYGICVGRIAGRRCVFLVTKDHSATPSDIAQHVRAEKSIFRIRGFGALKRAGESALAELTDLSPPPLDTFAVAASDWKETADTYGLFETDRDNADGIVETWAYDPAGLSGAHVVDRLSLYAQFRDHRDERVSMAAERLLEDMAW